MPINQLLKQLCLPIIYAGISLLLYTGTYFAHFFLSVICYIFIAAIDGISVNGMCGLLHIDYYTFVWRKLLYTTLITADKLIAVFLAWLLYRFRKKGDLGTQHSKWLLLSVLFPAISIFIAVLSAIGIPPAIRYEEVENTYAILAATMGPGWYYVVKAFHTGLVCGQAALFSLMIMSWIPNAYVGFLSPLIGYYMADCILSLLTRIVSSPLWSLVSPMQLFFGQPIADAGFSYLWAVLVLMVLSICFGIRFLLRLGKEYA